MELNEQQLELANHIHGPAICTAVAGSGKTTSMVQNIVNKVRSGIDPYNLVATTFTKDAADNIKTKVETSLGRNLDKALIGTSHSIGYKILREKGQQNLKLRKGWEAKKLVKEHAYGSKFPGYEDHYLSLISRLKNEKMFPKPTANMVELGFYQNYLNFMNSEEGLAAILPVKPDSFNEVFIAYEDWKNQTDHIDFDDMLIMPYVLLSIHKAAREEYQERCQYVLIDEYQDTNRIQYDFFKILAAPQNNIIVVGDDDQAIYGFRGAYPKYIRKFVKEYENCKVIKLEKNYRSQAGVLDAANTLIVNNKDRYEKVLVCTSTKEKVQPQVIEFIDDVEESRWAVNEIEWLISNGEQKSTIAVLARTNSQLSLFETRFIEKEIPYIMPGSSSFFEKPEIEVLLKYIKIAMDPKNSMKLIRDIVNKPYRKIGKAYVDRLKKWEDFADCDLAQLDALKYNIEELGDTYLRIKDGLKKPSALIEEILAGPIALLQWAEMEGMQSQGDDNPKDNLLMALQIMGMMEVSGSGLDGFLAKAEQVKEQKQLLEESGGDAVVLSTIHRAKGLEWEHVAVVGCCDEILPHKSSDDLEEERRLMYVAVTRAKSRLSLTYFMHRRDKEYTPSRFLSEMDDTLNFDEEARAECHL
jgi:DNA helicase-2/ATP-dependent DNA helicase PcrA